MCKVLDDNSEIGIIISSYKLSCHQDRLRGFEDKLNECNKTFHVIAIEENQDRKEDAFKTTLEFCNQYPNLKGIYITGGGVAGVGSALTLVNRNDNIHVICHDLVPDTLELLMNGIVDFALGQSPNQQGYQLVKILFEYLVKKQQPSCDYIEIPITIATQDSI